MHTNLKMIWNYSMHVHEKSAKETFSKWSRRGENESESAKNKKKKEEIYVSSFFSLSNLSCCVCTKHERNLSSYHIKRKHNYNFHNRIMFKWETLIILMSLRQRFKLKRDLICSDSRKWNYIRLIMFHREILFVVAYERCFQACFVYEV